MVNALFEQFQQMSSEDFEYIFKILLCDVHVRVLIAGSPKTPVNILEFLVEHEENELVIRELARNPKMPSFLLEKLYLKHTNSNKICYALAKNPNTPTYILEIFTTNKHSFIRGAAWESLIIKDSNQSSDNSNIKEDF